MKVHGFSFLQVKLGFSSTQVTHRHKHVTAKELNDSLVNGISQSAFPLTLQMYWFRSPGEKVCERTIMLFLTKGRCLEFKLALSLGRTARFSLTASSVLVSLSTCQKEFIKTNYTHTDTRQIKSLCILQTMCCTPTPLPVKSNAESKLICI